LGTLARKGNIHVLPRYVERHSDGDCQTESTPLIDDLEQVLTHSSSSLFHSQRLQRVKARKEKSAKVRTPNGFYDFLTTRRIPSNSHLCFKLVFYAEEGGEQKGSKKSGQAKATKGEKLLPVKAMKSNELAKKTKGGRIRH
jgi:hypothetical protein